MRSRAACAFHSTFDIQHSTFPGKGGGPLRQITRLFSRISLRLMLFNALLVFVPVAGFLLLGTYERHLERAQVESMFRQGRLVVAMMQDGGNARPNIDAGDTRY